MSVLVGGLVMGEDLEFRFVHYEFELPVRHSSVSAKQEVGLMD